MNGKDFALITYEKDGKEKYCIVSAENAEEALQLYYLQHNKKFIRVSVGWSATDLYKKLIANK